MGQLAKAVERKVERTQISSPGALQQVSYTTDSGIDLSFTAEDIRNQICGDATNKEIAQFMMLCKAQRLNPFMGDAFLVKYKNKNGKSQTSMITAAKVMFRRAEQNPHYKGYESGVVYQDREGTIRKRKGSSVYRAAAETLLGGWCAVFRDDREKPVYVEVSLDEYDLNQSLWKTKPAVMITKVAESTAHRKAFSDLSGMYAAEEFEQEEPAQAPAQPTTTPQTEHRFVTPEQEPEPTYEVEEEAELNSEELDRLRDMVEALGTYGYEAEGVRKTLWKLYNEGGLGAVSQYYELAVRQAQAGEVQ